MADWNDNVTVWWVDDDHANTSGPRVGEGKALARKAGPGLLLVPMHPADFEEHASNLANEPVPDLLLIDFRLGMQSHPDKDTPLFARDGVSLRGAMLGMEELKDVPAYLVSSVTKKRQAGSMDVRFDWVLTHRELTGDLGGTFLLDDARDYRRLRTALAAVATADTSDIPERRLVRGAVLDLLNVPADSVESVGEVLGHEVRTVLRNESVLDSVDLKLAPSRRRAISHWVRAALHRVRGPLIDERMAAAMLGTKLEYFEETLGPQLELESARYTGIFRSTAAMTLWRQALLERLLSASSDKIELSPPLALARTTAEYFNVPAQQQAVCRVCGERWPEAVGFDEEERTVDAAVHWRCSREGNRRRQSVRIRRRTELQRVVGLRQKSDQYRTQLEEMCKTLAYSSVVGQHAPTVVSGAQQLLSALRAYRKRAKFRLSLEPNWKVELRDQGVCGAPGQSELHFGGEMEFRDGCLERQVLTVVILFPRHRGCLPGRRSTGPRRGREPRRTAVPFRLRS